MVARECGPTYSTRTQSVQGNQERFKSILVGLAPGTPKAIAQAIHDVLEELKQQKQ